MAQKTGKKLASSKTLSRREMLKRSTGYAAGIAAMAASGSSASAGTQSFEYVVIGSGPGGGPLACNLARAGHTVCLMEAGGPATDPDLEALMKVPVYNSASTADPRIAWEYYVRHYADNTQQLKDSKYVAAKGGVLYPRASTIGGCAIHNVLVMMYPSDSDWQFIADLTGDPSWTPDLMRSYFQRMEQCRYTTPPFGPDTARHGFDGWQATELADPQIFYGEPQVKRLLQTAESVLGKPGDVNSFLQNKLDPNDYTTTQNDQQGLYGLPLSRLNGARWSVRDRVLETAAEYPNNLTIMTNCLVTRVLMNGDTATGVEYMQGEYLYRASPNADPKAAAPQTLEVRATREVIISAGTFNSPQILKLSGIGATSELSKLGIRTQIELPGVGVGMMDRYELGVVTQLKAPLTLFDNCVLGSATDPCFGAWLEGQGIYTTNLTAVTNIRKSDPSQPVRDMLIVLATGPFHGYFPGWQIQVINPTQFSWLLLKAHTQNRAGTVTLQSNDPRDMPVINFHYFNEGTDQAGQDLAGVVNGIQQIRQLNAQISDLSAGELVPGPAVQTPADIATFVKNEAWGHHASCSNPMGTSPSTGAVVNSEFKVFGTRNLRVVDASVFPRIPGYYPMIAIMMISEKASDVILTAARRGKKQEPPA
jgi:choline dehydrogenase